MRKYFYPRHVNALIPRLEQIFDHIHACRTRAETLAAQAVASPAASPEDLAQAQLSRSQAQFLIQAVREDIDSIASLGGVVKDLEAGLVDFPGWIDREEVWLCWKRGEPRVDFWHPLHAGYAARQALPRPEERTTTH